MTAICGVCDIHNNAAMNDLVAWESERWILRHHGAPAPLAGWFFLDTKRHVASAADFDALEEREFATILGAAMRAIRHAVGVPRVYVILFGEGAHHVHAHLIPRDSAQPGTSAWEIADWYRSVQCGERAPANQLQVARTIGAVSEQMRATVTI